MIYKTLSISPLDQVKHFQLKDWKLCRRPQLMTFTLTPQSSITICTPTLEAS